MKELIGIPKIRTWWNGFVLGVDTLDNQGIGYKMATSSEAEEHAPKILQQAFWGWMPNVFPCWGIQFP